jgi:hypothetical protein
MAVILILSTVFMAAPPPLSHSERDLRKIFDIVDGMNPSSHEILASACFGLALLHTFSCSLLQRWSERFERGSRIYRSLHILSELELVFAIWGAVYLLGLALLNGFGASFDYLRQLNFTEPGFVFVILTLCATAPVLSAAEKAIELVARALPFSPQMSFFLVSLILGPLLGSLITEPAAMTVVALLLRRRFYEQGIERSFAYAILGLLFVNVSVGGTLTSFAAPPVLMVAGPWNWDSKFMFMHFGWRGILACFVSTAWVAYCYRREIKAVPWSRERKDGAAPWWLPAVHLLFVLAVVIFAHEPLGYSAVLVGFFIFHRFTRHLQERLSLREGVLVAAFLAGLVVLGKPQKWWLEPLLLPMHPDDLFLGATLLTAITDNAALTFLGAQVPSLAELSKLALVSGAVVGGGLTVVANAPNPAGYGILNSAFEGGIRPLRLLWAAIPPTIMAAICFWFI